MSNTRVCGWIESFFAAKKPGDLFDIEELHSFLLRPRKVGKTRRAYVPTKSGLTSILKHEFPTRTSRISEGVWEVL